MEIMHHSHLPIISSFLLLLPLLLLLFNVIIYFLCLLSFIISLCHYLLIHSSNQLKNYSTFVGWNINIEDN